MRLVCLTLRRDSAVVFVNPDRVQWLDKAPYGGCYINFATGTEEPAYIEVSETIEQVASAFAQENVEIIRTEAMPK